MIAADNGPPQTPIPMLNHLTLESQSKGLFWCESQGTQRHPSWHLPSLGLLVVQPSTMQVTR